VAIALASRFSRDASGHLAFLDKLDKEAPIAQSLQIVNPDRILIIKPSALGDVVHTLPLLHLLRRRFVTAKISWLIAPSWKALIEKHPDLDEVILFDRKGLADLALGQDGMVRAIELSRELADRQFDLVIDVQGLLRSAALTWATHAPVRIGFGYAREGAWLAYTHRVGTLHHQRHAVERYLDVAEALGCGRGPIAFNFGVSASDYTAVASLLEGLPRFAVLLPGTNWATKRWPIEYFAQLAERIRNDLGLPIVVAGANDAIPLAAQIPFDLNLAGKTTLPQLVALLERASLVIANDSGPMHIAAALNRPLVTMFGPTNPVRTGPYRRPNTVVQLDIVCSPCYSRNCSHTSCMRWLTPDMVLAQARCAIENDRSPLASL
jgi:lipopolysaccharide heptosyltransferase I